MPARRRPAAAAAPAAELTALRNLGAVSGRVAGGGGGSAPPPSCAASAPSRPTGAVAFHRSGDVSLNLLYALAGALRGERWDRRAARGARGAAPRPPSSAVTRLHPHVSRSARVPFPSRSPMPPFLRLLVAVVPLTAACAPSATRSGGKLGAGRAGGHRCAPRRRAGRLLPRRHAAHALPLPAATRERYERQLAEARRAYERAPTDADSIVW
jgi:hypothetical protein